MIETLPNGIKIESGLVDELPATPDECEGRMALVNKLGLAGQKQTAARPKVIPFRVITVEQLVVYSAILSNNTELAKYSDEMIPLRVLELCEKAIDCGLFNLRVLHPEPGKIDPVVIANDHADLYRGNRYLIARWGAELDEWPALVKRAREAIREKCMTKIADMKHLMEQAEGDLSVFAPKVNVYGGLSIGG